MKIGKFIKKDLAELGHKFSATDTVAYVNRKLYEAGEWIYLAYGEYGLAIYDKSERGA